MRRTRARLRRSRGLGWRLVAVLWCGLAAMGAAAEPAEGAFAQVTVQLDAQGRGEAGARDAQAMPGCSLDPQGAAPCWQVLEIRGVTAGAYRIAYVPLPGETVRPLGVAPLYNAVIAASIVTPQEAVAEVYLQADPALLLVTTESGSMAVDAVAVAPCAPGTMSQALPTVRNSPAPTAFRSLLDALVPRRDTAASAARYRSLAPEEDTALLDATLARIFPAGRPTDQHAVALAILAYCAQTVQLKATGVLTGSAVLQQGHAYCHGMALAYAALCRRAGLPARVNALYNFGLMASHNLVEVFVEDAWRLYDPTYGTLFQAEDLGERPAAGLSLQALMSHAAPRVQVVQVDCPIGSGNYVVNHGWRALPGDARYGQWPFTLQVFYDELFALGGPVVWAEDAPAVFPVDLDLRETGAAWAGMVNGTPEDQFGKQPDGGYRRFAGAPALGPMAAGWGVHLLRLRSTEGGTCRVTLHGLPGGSLTSMTVKVLGGGQVTRVQQDLGQAVVECLLGEPEAWLLLAPTEGGVVVDAYHAAMIRAAAPG
jgi:transglutaminase-like putative cysteine protease